MPGIFISYRRGRTSAHAGRLYDRLAGEFGEDFVFMDLAAIGPGADFIERIEEGVGEADALLVVIGPDWLDARDAAGRSRLEDSSDFVRRELLGAQERDTLIVPVLVEGATMPTSEQLPESLAFLARRNATQLTEAGWSRDVGSLIDALKTRIPARPGGRPRAHGRRNRLALLTAVVAVAGAPTLFLLSSGEDDGGRAPGSAGELAVLREVRVGGYPLYATVLGDKVWVALENATRLKAVERDGGDTSDSARLGEHLSGLTASGVSLWVGDYGEDDIDDRGTVTRLDPSTGRPKGRPIHTTDPFEIATDGTSMWVTSTASLEVVDLRRRKVTARIDEVEEPFDVALRDGTAWVVDVKSGRLAAFDAMTGFPRGRPHDVGAAPVSVTATGSHVWVATFQGQLVRVPIDGGQPRSVAVGAEGNRVVEADERGVWVVDNRGLVVVVDPSTMKVRERLRLKGSLEDVSLDGNGAWILRARSGAVSAVTRVGPKPAS